MGAEEHVVHGGLRRGDLGILGPEVCEVVRNGEALVDLEVAVDYDGEAASLHAHLGGSLGVRGLDGAGLELVGGRRAVGLEVVLDDVDFESAGGSNELWDLAAAVDVKVVESWFAHFGFRGGGEALAHWNARSDE